MWEVVEEMVKAKNQQQISLAEILDLNYDISNENWRQLERLHARRVPALVEGVGRLIFWFLRSLMFLRHKPTACSVLFLVGSRNQVDSLRPVAEKTSGSLITAFHRQRAVGGHVPEGWFYLAGLRRLPRLLAAYRAVDSDYVRWTMRKRLDRYVLAVGAVQTWEKYLKSVRPRVLVVSNDHNVWTRSACKAAKRMRIPTVFIPHAPTGKHPPRMIFDYAFLDGLHQARQYETGGAKVLLAGAVRYEKLINSNYEKGQGVLVCFNKMDDMRFVEKIVKRVEKNFSGIIKIRPHPADEGRYKAFQLIASRHGVQFVSGDVPFSEVVKGVKYVMAGVSGVHVDALMAGLTPMTYSDWYEGDYYGLRAVNALWVLEADQHSSFSRINATPSSSHALNRHLLHPEIRPSSIIAAVLENIAAGVEGPFDFNYGGFFIRKEGSAGWYIVEECC